MTGLCHESSAAIDHAADYLVATPVRERPQATIPLLREMFGLLPVDALKAIRQANEIREGQHGTS